MISAPEWARAFTPLGSDDRLRGVGLDVPQTILDVAGRRVQDVAAVGELHAFVGYYFGWSSLAA